MKKTFDKDGNKYFLVEIPCPSCRDKGYTSETYVWKHGNNNCGGNMYLGDNAMLFCDKCESLKPLRRSSFKCHLKTLEEERLLFYEKEGSAYYILLSACGYLIDKTGKDWLLKCIQNL